MSNNDKSAIEAVINRYFRGMKEGDATLVRSSFHELGSFFGPFGDELIAAPISRLCDWVDGNLEPGASGENHRLEISSIEQMGPIAVVRCREFGFLGHDFDEVFTLLRQGGDWQITNKSYATLQ